MVDWLVNLQVEQLPEGCYLATCASIPGLVALGRTLTETLEIARNVARQLHEAHLERGEREAPPVFATAITQAAWTGMTGSRVDGSQS